MQYLSIFFIIATSRTNLNADTTTGKLIDTHVQLQRIRTAW